MSDPQSIIEVSKERRKEMGTRGITQVIDVDGVVRVAQYGQWDHYPSGQGLNILEFISGYRNLDRLRMSLNKAYFATDEELQAAVDSVVNNDGWMSMDEADKFSVMFPSLTRDTCSDILKVLVYSSGRVPLRNDIEFIQDDLFCEGVFTINYQTNEFISNCGVEVRFPLDNLPTADVYLNAFREAAVA
jgi:hypothetical protein